MSYARDLIRTMGARVWLAVALMVAVGLTEGFGVLLLVPLLQLTGLEIQQGAAAALAGFIAAGFARIGLSPTLPSVLALFAAVMTVQALAYRWQAIVNARLEYDFALRLRQRLYAALVRSSWLFFSRSRSADFAHGLTAEIERVGLATQFLLSLLATSAVAVAYVALALRLSAGLTLLVFGSAAALLVLLRGRTEDARRAGEGLSQAGNALYGAILEHLSGMKTVKSYGAEERNVKIFEALTGSVAGRHVDATVNHAGLRAWFDVGSMLVLSGMLYCSIRLMALSTADVLLLIFLFARIMPRASTVQQHYHHFVNLLPAHAAIARIETAALAAREQEGDPPDGSAVRPQPARPEPVERVEGRTESPPTVAFENVSFRYAADRAWVVEDLNLSLTSGRTTALVGLSGAGKSSVADLAMGLIVPQAGELLIDGRALDRTRLGAWRARIGYVAQDTFLFHDSVRANLIWANPRATDAQIADALHRAAADRFVANLPQGLDTVLGDRAQSLSGGERQRLALARALLRQPSLLILDEATSHVDSEHERQILERIDALHGQMTILVITHRLAAVRGADSIHVLEQGRIVESGTWQELTTRQDGRFARLLLDLSGTD